MNNVISHVMISNSTQCFKNVIHNNFHIAEIFYSSLIVYFLLHRIDNSFASVQVAVIIECGFIDQGIGFSRALIIN